MTKSHFKVIPAVYLFLRRDNEVLLLKRANTGYQDGNYSVPAGHMDGGELAIAAIIREAKEEAGISLKPDDINFVNVGHRLNGSPEQERLDLFFEAWKWEGTPSNMEPEKCDDLAWFSIDNLPGNMVPYVKLVLEKSIKGERYSEYAIEP